jgi:hypothetical protein
MYSQTNGVLQVAAAHGDPNHLLYMGPGGSNNVQEVLARVRMVAFGTGDAPRGGICVGTVTNLTGAGSNPATNWSALNIQFRDFVEDNSPARHFRMLDDLRAWGPHLDKGWTNNAWYWMRLRMDGGTNPVLGKVWLADGTTPEPSAWQMSWANSSLTKPLHAGYAGITGCSNDGLGQSEVDYILIKSPSLPSITVNFAPQGPASNPPELYGANLKGTNLVVEWFGGNLQSATAVSSGTWTNLITASPATNAISAAPVKFFRVRQ